MSMRDKAIAGWGDPLPDWVALLVDQVEQGRTQEQIGGVIGYSGSAVSMAIRNVYRGGDIERFADAVRGAYQGATVDCPVLGELEMNACLHHQRQKYSHTNHMRVRLYKACRRCSNRRAS